MGKFLSKLGPFKWSLHNIVAHPISELVYLIGFERAGNWIHDVTVPEHDPEAVLGAVWPPENCDPRKETLLMEVRDLFYPSALRTKIKTCTRNYGVQFVHELVLLDRQIFLGWKHVGKRTLAEVERVLIDEGLSFGMPPEEITKILA